MKNLLRHLVPILLVTFAFVSGMNRSDFVNSENQADAFDAKMEVHCWDSTTYHQDLHLPYQTSRTNIFRSHNTSKRTNNPTYRNSFEFVKPGKVIHTGNGNSNYSTSLKFPKSLVKTVYRLISLGRLII